MRYFVSLAGASERVDVNETAPGEYRVDANGQSHVVSIVGDNVLVDGRVVSCRLDEKRGRTDLGTLSVPYEISREDPKLRGKSTASSRPELRSPMPGKVVELRVAEGASVTAGQCLVVIEAMKMQNELTSPLAGTVKRVLVTVGKAVEPGALLIELTAAPEAT